MRRWLALAGCVAVAGCGGDRRAPVPRRESAPAKVVHRVVHFRASDGHRLHGKLTPAARRGAPAVVLVHGLYGEPGQWDAFAGDLHRAGFTTFAYASRRDDETDEAVLARDLTGAVRALRRLPEVDPDRIVLTGASVGGSAVAYALATEPRLPARGGVGISAIEGPREVALAKRRAYRPHDLLLISDQREVQNARELRADAHDRGTTISTVEATGHGSALLTDPNVRALALAWLRRLTRG